VELLFQAAASQFRHGWETPAFEQFPDFSNSRCWLDENVEELLRCNTRETGRPLRLKISCDVKRGSHGGVCLAASPPLWGRPLANIARGIYCARSGAAGRVRRITPFNFSAMVPLWVCIRLLGVLQHLRAEEPSEKVAR